MLRVSRVFEVLTVALGVVSCRHEEASGPPPVWHNLYGPNGEPVQTGTPSTPGPQPSPSQPNSQPQPQPPSAKGPRAPWAVANLDPNDDFVVGPPAEISDCMARLTALGVRAHAGEQPVHSEGKQTCGAPQVVVYDVGPTGVRWSSPPKVTCLVALALARFETILQEEAQRNFAVKVKRVDHMGTYSCRPMVRFNMASEHSFANAIDFSGVELENGKRITVDAHWGPPAENPISPEGRFMRAVGHRLYEEDVFSVVLSPAWDALHKNHLHLDQARYRVDATRPR